MTNSAFNLVNSNMVQAVFSSCPQRDGFEVDSLVEDSNKEKFQFFSNSSNKGFVSDTFIRAPVSIYIGFKEPIQIESIIIDGKVNMQISNGFQIWTSTENNIDKETYLKGGGSFYSIGKFINEKNRNAHIYEFRRRGDQDSTPDNSCSCFFGTRNLANLNCVRSIRVDILRTLTSSSPCLRSIKVIGRPVNSPSGLICDNKKVEEDNIIRPVKVAIPIEFMDELTHELMRVPIRLPSKKYIDKSTLDKYVSEREKGRGEVIDPFTRLPFSSSHKPIIDEVLKSRIDKFLFDNRSAQLVAHTSPPSSPTRTAVTTKTKSSDLPAKQRASKRFKSEEHVFVCNLCLNKRDSSSSIPYYQLEACKHVFCRSCLITSENVCSKCKIAFRNSQVTNVDKITI